MVAFNWYIISILPIHIHPPSLKQYQTTHLRFIDVLEILVNGIPIFCRFWCTYIYIYIYSIYIYIYMLNELRHWFLQGKTTTLPRESEMLLLWLDNCCRNKQQVQQVEVSSGKTSPLIDDDYFGFLLPISWGSTEISWKRGPVGLPRASTLWLCPWLFVQGFSLLIAANPSGKKNEYFSWMTN